jgi:hypothetical protein
MLNLKLLNVVRNRKIIYDGVTEYPNAILPVKDEQFLGSIRGHRTRLHRDLSTGIVGIWSLSFDIQSRPTVTRNHNSSGDKNTDYERQVRLRAKVIKRWLRLFLEIAEWQGPALKKKRWLGWSSEPTVFLPS